jgi:Zn-dependent protease
MEPQRPVFTVEPPGTTTPSRPAPRAGRGIGALLTAAGVLALKFGKTFLSMGFMIWAYSWIYGWKFAAGFVGLIFVHEMGHFVAAMALGIPVSAPIFIPFLGASIIMKQNPRDAVTEAIMAYAGPLAGGAGSWATLWAADTYDIPWLAPVAAVSFGINLFNLIPVPPLDGGRVCAAVSRWFWVPGLLLLGLAVVYFHAWSMLLIGGLVFWMAFRRVRDDMRYREQMGNYYRIPILTRVAVGAFYLGLIGALFVGLTEASQLMPPLQQ